MGYDDHVIDTLEGADSSLGQIMPVLLWVVLAIVLIVTVVKLIKSFRDDFS